MKVKIDIKGAYDFHQVIDVKNKKGDIKITGTSTNEKLEMVAKGVIGGKKMDVKYAKEAGKKATIKVKESPKKQLKHFAKKYEKIAAAWEAKIKGTAKPAKPAA